MSRTRSRAFRSSSQGELTVLCQLRPIESPVALFEKTRPALVIDVKPLVEKPRPLVTFTIVSPERDDDSRSKTKKIDEGYCGFLQSCSLCKKKFKKNENFYMYGYGNLRAFCSPDCREDQMALDGFEEEIAKETISAAMMK